MVTTIKKGSTNEDVQAMLDKIFNQPITKKLNEKSLKLSFTA